MTLFNYLDEQLPRQKQRVVSTLLTTPSPASEVRLCGEGAEFHIVLFKHRSAFLYFGLSFLGLVTILLRGRMTFKFLEQEKTQL